MIKIFDYNEQSREQIFINKTGNASVESAVAEIIARVKKEGDRALIGYTKQFDKVSLDSLEVVRSEIDEAYSKVDKKLIDTIILAAENIRQFHSHQVRSSFVITKDNGVVMGQKIIPIDRVGLYVPGGTAAYPSTVLMDAIPAVIAGCEQIVMVTPPGSDGKISPAILVAADVAGVSRIFKVGGAQAIAALAYGTESVPRVDKIVGPGNVFVAEAKKQVFGQVSIDMIAGPSEILIIADEKSDPQFVAADMLSQAEHDKMASAVLVTDSKELASAVSKAIEERLTDLPRREIARASIDDNGKIIIVSSIEKAIEVANLIAPEHLELHLDNPFDYLGKIKHAGSVFMGRYCPESLGDYLAGPNHTLPTSGTARFSSPLSVDDFVKKTQYTYFTADALSAVAENVAIFAEAEGLSAHARSATVRIKK